MTAASIARVTPLRDGERDPIRLPPLNVEAEQALLGAIFRNNLAHGRVSDFLEPDHFSNAVHGRIYEAIGKLVERGQIANPVTLKNLFDQDGALAEIGGAQYLARLAEAAVTIINAEDYGRRIHDLHLRRQLIAFTEDAQEAAYRIDLDDDAHVQLARAEAALQVIGHRLPSTLDFTVAADLAGIQPADQPWLIEHWVPRRQVTLLSGDGGVGKSLLALQLQASTACGRRWLGLPTMPCRSFGLYAEDEGDEIHRRLLRVCELYDADIGNLRDMAWRSAVADAAELVEVDEAGGVRPTAYFRQVERLVKSFRARLVVLDATTNLYGADEIRRRQVNGFLTLLRRLAVEIDGAVVLLAHPSAAGISTGSGLSGSTHWNNAVRSRLYFTRATGDDADPDERWLARLKANYAGSGDTLRVRWRDGAFVPLDDPTGIDRAAVSAKAERVFLSLLGVTYASCNWVSGNAAARNYAPRVFSQHPDREALGKAAFEAAMYRLQKFGSITTETYGRPSEPRSRLALA